MQDCKIEIGVTSALPDLARGTHGNLADQQRIVGPARGVDTLTERRVPAAKTQDHSAAELARKNNCMACHQLDKKLIGPSLLEIAGKYQGDAGAVARLADKVKNGGGGVWGAIPMPPNALREEELSALVRWILAGAK
jgi:S-disulfanyl-L-cysteine oxidoreductase SoxD